MADKTLKSLNFGGADNYFPFPLVTAADNDKILSVVNGEWATIDFPGNSGKYVWSKKDSANGPVIGYVISNDYNKYPDGGWSEGFYYTLELEPITYLIFTGNEDFTLKTYNTTKNWDGTLEYSTDASTWNTWNGTEISSTGSKLYLRGTGNTKITISDSKNYRFVFTGTNALKIACKGNIENLLDYETVRSGDHPAMAEYCYASIFNGCTALTTAPELPATTLADRCYRYMFSGCTALTTAPALPATTLAGECYSGMFKGCASLTIAPELPATTLADYCYYAMFSGCTSLTSAPELPVTTLADSCYNSMFNGCTALTTAPELPATTLAKRCYRYMFEGCTSLAETPSLPATTLTDYCYQWMFRGCTALTTAPALPATTLASDCYESMFNRCTSLTTPPSVLPATTLTTNCYRYMFEFTAISAIPRIMATTYATDSCKGMFDDIKTLNVYSTSGTGHTYGWTAPSSASTYCSGMFGSDDSQSEWAKLDGSNFPNSGTPTDGKTYYFKTVAYLTFTGNEDFTLKTGNTTKNWDGTLEYSTDKSTWNTWNGAEISSVGSKLYLRGTGNTKITGNSANYRFVFTGTGNLKIACRGNIETLLDYITVSAGGHPTMATNCYRYMFRDCTALTTAPELPATKLAGYCYRGMFSGCTALTTAPELPATTLADNCYQGMFSGCTALTTAPALPATTLAGECYSGMFKGCTSLTTPPSVLPATTLAVNCYRYMFQGCTSLTTPPSVLPATTLADSCYYEMFYGCTSLAETPSLPATTLAVNCYRSMFKGCTSLTTAPALPATTLADSCYYEMFYGCTSLAETPSLPATTLAVNCYRYMFQGCTSLTTPPSVLPATTLANWCYRSMFKGCTSLTTAPALPATTLADSCYQSMFSGCTSLAETPSLPATTLAVNCYQRMFDGCTNIKLSTTQTGEYQTAYRIPTSGTGANATDALTNMFINTGGTFTGTPEINTTYYTSNTVV